MENQRNNSGKEQEKLKNQLQNAQEKAKTAAKELKDVKSKEEILKRIVRFFRSIDYCGSLYVCLLCTVSPS